MRLFKSQRHKYRNNANTKAHLGAWDDGMGRYSDRSSLGSEYASASEREPRSEWRSGAYTGDFTAGSMRRDDDWLETEVRHTMECMDGYEKEKNPVSGSFVSRSRTETSARLGRRTRDGRTFTEDDKRKELYKVYRSQRKERKQTEGKRTKLAAQEMFTALQDINETKLRLGINNLTRESGLASNEVTNSNTVSYMLNKLSLLLTDNIDRYEADCGDNTNASMYKPSTVYSTCGQAFEEIGRRLSRTFQPRSTKLTQVIAPSDHGRYTVDARAQAVWPPPPLAENSIWAPTAEARRRNNLLFCNSIRLASHSSIDTNTSKTQSCLLNGLSALTNVSRSPSQKTVGRGFLDNLIADFADRQAECTDKLDREEWEVERKRSALLESDGLSTHISPSSAESDSLSLVRTSINMKRSQNQDNYQVSMDETKAESDRKVKEIEAEMYEWEECYDAGLRAREALSMDV